MDDREVLVPIWVLKTKVEVDYEEYKFLVGAGPRYLEEDEPEEFPIADSTIEILKILEKEGITFNNKTGEWD